MRTEDSVKYQERDERRRSVLLVESVITDRNQPDLGKLLDIEMLVSPGGKERTAQEYRTA